MPKGIRSGKGRSAALVTAPLDGRRAPGSGLRPGGDGARPFFLRPPGAPRRESGPLGRRLHPRDAWLWVGGHPGQGRAPPMIPPHPRAVSLHTPEGSPTPQDPGSLSPEQREGWGHIWAEFHFHFMLSLELLSHVPFFVTPWTVAHSPQSTEDLVNARSSVHGILQVRILERVATLFSRGSS